MSENAASLPEETRPANRQELWDRIRRGGSREEVILQDMKRLGFWPATADKPSVAEQIITREAELTREIRSIIGEQRRVENPEALLKELRKQRMAESRKKREENKQRRELERKERAERWKQRKEKEILYLGDKHSGGLGQLQSDEARLQQLGLPLLPDATALAQAMGISLGELRFLSFARAVSRTSHYRRFYIPKKTGGKRMISAPMPRLKKIQYWVLDHILKKPTLHDAAHGFADQRSIVSNARPHVGAEVVINIDLKDFFPTVTYPRIKGVFQKLGYSECTATILALICTEPDIDEANLDGETWYLSNGERFLPQGAPTSPALTNILCYKLDRRLHGLAQKLGFTYTRYADDLTFSASGDGVKNINTLKSLVAQIIQNEGFIIHPDKQHVMRKGSRKEVTGIVVNDKLNIDRETLRRFRALLHQIEKTGIAGKKWGNGTDVLASIQGFANYVAMVDADKGKALQEKVKKIVIQAGGVKIPRKTYPTGKYSLVRTTAATEKTTTSQASATDMSTDTKDNGLKQLWSKFWKK